MLACVLASVLGFEREIANKPAGLRTHVLVAAAVVVFIFVGRHLVANAAPNTQPDPVRMIEAIATAVSFLGAGTIIFRKAEGVVEGLTTASSLLLVAGVAMATALELYVIAVGVTIFAFAVLRGLRVVERHLPHHAEEHAPKTEREERAPPRGEPRGEPIDAT